MEKTVEVVKELDLAALRGHVQRILADSPTVRAITIDTSYGFDLSKRGVSVKVSLQRGDKVYVYQGVGKVRGRVPAKSSDRLSDDSRILIVQHGFQVLVEFSPSGTVKKLRWLMANPQYETEALVS